MISVATKPELSQPCSEPQAELFDDWFDLIESGVRERVRGIIEDLIHGGLKAVLARPGPGVGRRGAPGAGCVVEGVAGDGKRADRSAGRTGGEAAA